MPRSGEDARRRLRDAALELFGERGYDAVTTAEIAARAGVTERTFFRHFPDKREALFDGEEAFRDALSEAVVGASEDLDPMGALELAFGSVEQMIWDNREFSVPRTEVIARSPALQERVLTKAAGLTSALARALGRRGVEPALATLAAQAGMAAFSYATGEWSADPASGLKANLRRAFAQLHTLSATPQKGDHQVRPR